MVHFFFLPVSEGLKFGSEVSFLSLKGDSVLMFIWVSMIYSLRLFPRLDLPPSMPL